MRRERPRRAEAAAGAIPLAEGLATKEDLDELKAAFDERFAKIERDLGPAQVRIRPHHSVAAAQDRALLRELLPVQPSAPRCIGPVGTGGSGGKLEAPLVFFVTLRAQGLEQRRLEVVPANVAKFLFILRVLVAVP